MGQRKATILGIAALFMWSSTIAVTRSLTESIGPLTTAGATFTLAGLFALLFHYWRSSEFPKLHIYSPHYLYGCGALFVLYSAVLYFAIAAASTRSQVLEIGLVNYLWPILTVVFSIPLLHYASRWIIWPGLVVSLAGMALVASPGESISLQGFVSNVLTNPLAYLLALTAAISWGLYSNLSRKWGSGDALGAVSFFMLATGLIMFFGRLIVEEPGIWSGRVAAEMFFLSVATSLGYVFWDIGVRKGNFVVVSISSYFTPLLSTVIAWIYLEAHAGVNLWLGCMLLIAGALFSKLGIQGEARSTEY